MDIDIFKTKPYFVNELGTKFWLDKSSIDYAKEKKLKEVKVYYLEDKKGYKTRAIVQNHKYVFESQKLEDIVVHLDIMSLIKEK